MSDFAWVPDYTVSSGAEWKTLESEMESGVKQYRQKHASETQSWRLTFKNRTLTETQAILAFFNSKHGKADSFTWTSPLDSVEYTVRFKSDKFNYDYVSYNYCDFEIEFEEDLS